MKNAIAPEHLAPLKRLEDALQKACRLGKVDRAQDCIIEIQILLKPYGNHHRLLQAKLWFFECVLDANNATYAESGFIDIRRKANKGTRIYLEATLLLAVCYIRKKDISTSKPLFKYVINNINNVKSDRTRRRFHKEVLNRIEQECILSELIGSGNEILDPESVHEKAVFLIQNNSDHDIYVLIGNALPSSAVNLLEDVRHFAVLQIAVPDQKFLPAPKEATKPLHLGKLAMAVIKRIGYRALCDPDSSLHKLWSKKVDKVYSSAYFAAAIAQSFNQWKIGLLLLGSGLAAIAMKCSAAEFCEMAKPESLMDSRGKGDEKL
jgi:hypothetical protein